MTHESLKKQQYHYLVTPSRERNPDVYNCLPRRECRPQIIDVLGIYDNIFECTAPGINLAALLHQLCVAKIQTNQDMHKFRINLQASFFAISLAKYSQARIQSSSSPCICCRRELFIRLSHYNVYATATTVLRLIFVMHYKQRYSRSIFTTFVVRCAYSCSGNYKLFRSDRTKRVSLVERCASSVCTLLLFFPHLTHLTGCVNLILKISIQVQ